MKRTLMCLSLGATLALSTALMAQPMDDAQSPAFSAEESFEDSRDFGHSHDDSSSCSSCSGPSYTRAKCGYGQCGAGHDAGRCGVDCGWGKVYSYGIDNNVVDIEKRMSSCIQLGQEFCMQIRAKAYAEAEDIVIKTTIPEGAEYIDSDPAAQVVDNELLWRFDEMCSGESRYINVWFHAAEEGSLSSCTSVHAVPSVCACTTVGDPDLQVCKEGPEVVVEGDTVNYYVTVYNNGTYPAFDVCLRDEIPEGMYHHSGDYVLHYDLGTIYPSGSKTVQVQLCAIEALKGVCNKAIASSCNAGEASDQVCTDILRQGIEVTKVGTESLYVGKIASYSITVTNTGENELHQVVVVDDAPDGSFITDAPNASWNYNSARWTIDMLAPGETRTFSVSMGRDCTGYVCNTVYVNSCEGASGEARFQTEWRGFPALSIEMVDECDPICIGEHTCYTVRVENQGTAADHHVQIAARFSDELLPVDTEGYSQGDIAGQAIMFEPVESLYPNEYVEYKIYVEGVKTGDGRVRIDLKSKLLEEPVSEEESTHVY